MDFFVKSIASQRTDMEYFTASRLKLFRAGQLFNSGKRVELYAGRGKAAAARGWLLAKDAPEDALMRIPRVWSMALPSRLLAPLRLSEPRRCAHHPPAPFACCLCSS